jgi:hypothetical protein
MLVAPQDHHVLGISAVELLSEVTMVRVAREGDAIALPITEPKGLGIDTGELRGIGQVKSAEGERESEECRVPA